METVNVSSLVHRDALLTFLFNTNAILTVCGSNTTKNMHMHGSDVSIGS